MQELITPDLVTYFELDGIGSDVLGVSHAVKARHTGHHDDVAASAQQCGHGGEPQPFDFVVDGKVFLDILVSRWNISLGLVVVVVGDEVMHGVLGKETLELGIQLRCQRLIV